MRQSDDDTSRGSLDSLKFALSGTPTEKDSAPQIHYLGKSYHAKDFYHFERALQEDTFIRETKNKRVGEQSLRFSKTDDVPKPRSTLSHLSSNNFASAGPFSHLQMQQSGSYLGSLSRDMRQLMLHDAVEDARKQGYGGNYEEFRFSQIDVEKIANNHGVFSKLQQELRNRKVVTNGFLRERIHVFVRHIRRKKEAKKRGRERY